MPTVVFKEIKLNVNVSKDIMAIHSPGVDQNVSSTVIVQVNLLASIKSVAIHVLELVAWKLSAL